MTTLLIKGEQGKETRWRADILLTDEHAASSYGLPVAIVDGVAYGAEDHCEALYPHSEISDMFLDSKIGSDVRVIVHSHQKADADHPLVLAFCGDMWA